MKGTFVITTVGDLLIQEPIGQTIDTKIQDLLRNADTTVGNMETKIIDRRRYRGGFRGNWSPKETAVDIRNLGFDILTGANNHTFDMGEQGLQSTIDLLDAQGIPLAGVGPNLSIARMPVFHYTPKGRVAMVGAYAVAMPSGQGGVPGAATDREGAHGRQHGLQPAAPDDLERGHAISSSPASSPSRTWSSRTGVTRMWRVRSLMPKDAPGRVTVFDSGRYMSGPKPGSYHYEVNKGDEEGNLLAIRNAKEYADFAVFTMHAHQNRYAYQAYSNDNYPADYLQELRAQADRQRRRHVPRPWQPHHAGHRDLQGPADLLQPRQLRGARDPAVRRRTAGQDRGRVRRDSPPSGCSSRRTCGPWWRRRSTRTASWSRSACSRWTWARARTGRGRR